MNKHINGKGMINKIYNTWQEIITYSSSQHKRNKIKIKRLASTSGKQASEKNLPSQKKNYMDIHRVK